MLLAVLRERYLLQAASHQQGVHQSTSKFVRLYLYNHNLAHSLDRKHDGVLSRSITFAIC